LAVVVQVVALVLAHLLLMDLTLYFLVSHQLAVVVVVMVMVQVVTMLDQLVAAVVVMVIQTLVQLDLVQQIKVMQAHLVKALILHTTAVVVVVPMLLVIQKMVVMVLPQVLQDHQ
jgi:hypothetical protein